MTNIRFSTEKAKGLWLIMDGRARLDVNAATILEADEGTRDYIPRKWARMGWQGQEAVLCFAPFEADGAAGNTTYIEDVG